MTAEVVVSIAAIVLSVVLGLLGVSWGLLRSQNAEQGRRILALEQQNASQETTLAALTQRMIAREDAHHQHREDMGNALARLEAGIKDLGTKIDRMSGRGTPYPTTYRTGDKPGGGE